MRKVNLPEDLEGPDDSFFNHQIVDLILAQAGTKMVTDWHSFGDTTKEKYDGLYVKLREMTNILLAKGAKGYFWLITPLDINELLEVNGEKKFVTVPMEQLPLGYNCVLFTGIYNKRWRMYTDPLLSDTIVMGATFTKKVPAYYGTLKVERFGTPKPKEGEKVEEVNLMNAFYPE